VTGSAGSFTGGSWSRTITGGAVGSQVLWGGTVRIDVTVNVGYRHHTNATIRDNLSFSGGGGGAGAATVSFVGTGVGTTTRQYFISNIRGNISNISFSNLSVATISWSAFTQTHNVTHGDWFTLTVPTASLDVSDSGAAAPVVSISGSGGGLSVSGRTISGTLNRASATQVTFTASATSTTAAVSNLSRTITVNIGRAAGPAAQTPGAMTINAEGTVITIGAVGAASGGGAAQYRWNNGGNWNNLGTDRTFDPGNVTSARTYQASSHYAESTTHNASPSWSGNVSFAHPAYTVSFNANRPGHAPAGSVMGTTPAALTKMHGTRAGNAVSLPSMTFSGGWTFLGWNTAANGSGTAWSGSYTANASVTLFAQWSQNAMSFSSQTLAGGIGGRTYNQTFNAATGTDQTFTYNFVSGAPSPGLTVNYSNRNVSGTLGHTTSIVTSTFRVQANSSNGRTAQEDISIAVTPESYTITINGVTIPIGNNAANALANFSLGLVSNASPWTAATSNTASPQGRWHGSQHIITINTRSYHVFHTTDAIAASGSGIVAHGVSTTTQRQFRVDFLSSNVSINFTMHAPTRVLYNPGVDPNRVPTGGGTWSPAALVEGSGSNTDNRLKVHNVAFTVNPAQYVNPTNNNWNHVGWSTDANITSRLLSNRNFVPNPTGNPMTIAAGTSMVNLTGTTPITWTTVQRQVPSDVNAQITLYPIWAPQQTDVTFALGERPPQSGTITGATETRIRYTGQRFTYPVSAGSSAPHFVVTTGALWAQVGWIRNTTTANGAVPIASRIHRPLTELTTNFAGGFVLNGHDIALGSNHEGWGTSRTYFPVWRRVITEGSVNIFFIGGPDGFMDEDIEGLGLGVSAVNPFTVNGSVINYADTTTQFTLPSFNQMRALGEEHGLTFQGWFMRTMWDHATVRIDNAAQSDDRVVIPWHNGIFPTTWEPFGWEPYIWIEARWG
jgi:hypothetical protein